MTAREFMEQVCNLDYTIERKVNQAKQLRDSITNPCSRITGMPRGKGGQNQKIMDVVAIIADLEHEIDNDVDTMVSLKQCLIEAMTKLTVPEHVKVLELRYLKGMPWAKIAADMGYHAKHVPKVHARALEAIAPFIENEAAKIKLILRSD